MSDLSERHEVRVRGQGQTIVFIAESEDGRLLIRQEFDGKKAKDESGESVEAIARARKRSPRAIELRLQRLGGLPRDAEKTRP
jgi:hypothetical protein